MEVRIDPFAFLDREDIREEAKLRVKQAGERGGTDAEKYRFMQAQTLIEMYHDHTENLRSYRVEYDTSQPSPRTSAELDTIVRQELHVIGQALKPNATLATRKRAQAALKLLRRSTALLRKGL